VSEIESRDPEGGGLTLVNPILDKLETLHEVEDVTGETLEGGVGVSYPETRDLVIEDGVGDFFELD